MPVAKGHVKRVFPGGNTSKGFFSFYDQIIGPDAARIFVIKGGPGVGKSSFMKFIGEAMSGRGYDVEYHHCSSDNNSLDGLVIPAIGVGLIDGTAPHIVDPKNPGCVDEILHLGDYWDEKAMVSGKSRILELNREAGRLFQRAYRYLAAARAVYDDWEACNGFAFEPGVANRKAEAVKEALFAGRPVAGKPGGIRRLFATAITPDGPRNYLETVFDRAERLWIVTGEPGSGKATLLAKLTAEAVERGLMTECFHCAFDPDKIEHIWWPELRAGVTTSVWPHTYLGRQEIAVTVEMNETLNHGIRESCREPINAARRSFLTLFNLAVDAIREAKEVHDEMEKHYAPNMDFAGIDRLREGVLERILRYAEEKEKAATAAE